MNERGIHEKRSDRCFAHPNVNNKKLLEVRCSLSPGSFLSRIQFAWKWRKIGRKFSTSQFVIVSYSFVQIARGPFFESIPSRKWLLRDHVKFRKSLTRTFSVWSAKGLGSTWHFRVEIVIEFSTLTFKGFRKFFTKKFFKRKRVVQLYTRITECRKFRNFWRWSLSRNYSAKKKPFCLCKTLDFFQLDILMEGIFSFSFEKLNNPRFWRCAPARAGGRLCAIRLVPCLHRSFRRIGGDGELAPRINTLSSSLWSLISLIPDSFRAHFHDDDDDANQCPCVNANSDMIVTCLLILAILVSPMSSDPSGHLLRHATPIGCNFEPLKWRRRRCVPWPWPWWSRGGDDDDDALGRDWFRAGIRQLPNARPVWKMTPTVTSSIGPETYYKLDVHTFS